jgi:hypothetical protein
MAAQKVAFLYRITGWLNDSRTPSFSSQCFATGPNLQKERKRTPFFFNFSCGCPEPVWVNRPAVFSIKRRFIYTHQPSGPIGGGSEGKRHFFWSFPYVRPEPVLVK